MLRHEVLSPLSRQHHNGLALVVLAGRGMEKRGDRAAADWSARVVERYDMELANHFEAEEKVLFPAATAALGEMALVDELVAEHRKMESLVAELRKKPARVALEEFLELLRTHIRREENELFEAIQERMPPEALEALGGPIKERVVESCLKVENNEQ